VVAVAASLEVEAAAWAAVDLPAARVEAAADAQVVAVVDRAVVDKAAAVVSPVAVVAAWAAVAVVVAAPVAAADKVVAVAVVLVEEEGAAARVVAASLVAEAAARVAVEWEEEAVVEVARVAVGAEGTARFLLHKRRRFGASFFCITPDCGLIASNCEPTDHSELLTKSELRTNYEFRITANHRDLKCRLVRISELVSQFAISSQFEVIRWLAVRSSLITLCLPI